MPVLILSDQRQLAPFALLGGLDPSTDYIGSPRRHFVGHEDVEDHLGIDCCRDGFHDVHDRPLRALFSGEHFILCTFEHSDKGTPRRVCPAGLMNG